MVPEALIVMPSRGLPLRGQENAGAFLYLTSGFCLTAVSELFTGPDNHAEIVRQGVFQPLTFAESPSEPEKGPPGSRWVVEGSLPLFASPPEGLPLTSREQAFWVLS